jgi:FkbH-like protein
MPAQLHVVSDFNVEPLARLLRAQESEHGLSVKSTDYGQVIPSLRAPLEIADIVVVWARPESISAGFQRALQYERVSEESLLADVDMWADILLDAASRCAMVLLANWTLPIGYRGLGPLEGKRGLGAGAQLLQMNAHLAQRLANASNVLTLDPATWFAAIGPASSTPKMWHAAKVPYSPQVFAEAAADVRAAIAGLRGEARRVIVLDLDDTLWGGVVGETGWQGVHLGGHHHLGEAFAEFQRALKSMARRGIQLAIASKNDEAVAMEAITQHPEMVLRRDAFSAWRISWQDKATSIRELADELNLGLKSFVFIDDNPSERGRVRELLPDVLVPEWPADPTRYVQALQALRCFDTTTISKEDEARTQMYADERSRREAAKGAGGSDAWLESLGVVVTCKRLGADDLPRATQLLNKTNQLNLATRRLSETELLDWSHRDGHEVWTFRVEDRFGESGLTGLLSLAKHGDSVEIVDYLLSCRVMGRKVEETMLHHAWARAQALGASQLSAQFLPTERNGPCLQLWKSSGFTEHDTLQFSWSVDAEYARPASVTLHTGPDA